MKPGNISPCFLRVLTGRPVLTWCHPPHYLHSATFHTCPSSVISDTHSSTHSAQDRLVPLLHRAVMTFYQFFLNSSQSCRVTSCSSSCHCRHSKESFFKWTFSLLGACFYFHLHQIDTLKKSVVQHSLKRNWTSIDSMEEKNFQTYHRTKNRKKQEQGERTFF